MVGRMSKKRRRCRSKLAFHSFAMKRTSEWKDVLEEMEGFTVLNPKGRTRSIEENQLIIGSVKMLLWIYLDFVEKKFFCIHDLNWTFIDNQIALNLGVKQGHDADLRKQYFENDQLEFDIEFTEQEQNESQTSDVTLASSICSYRTCTDDFMAQAMVDEIDRQHARGKTITNHLMRNFIYQTFNLKMCRKTMGKYFQKLGLS